MNWLRYGWPRRRIVKLACWMWKNNTPEWLLLWLYPNDMEVKFK